MSRKRRGSGGDPSREPGSVGYCRPPVDQQFKKGAPSPNPYGRGGKPRALTADAAREPDFLDGFVTISIDGKPKRVTRDEAIDHALFVKAAAGDVGASRRLDERRADRRWRAEAEQRAAAISARASFDPTQDEGVIERALDRRNTAPLARAPAGKSTAGLSEPEPEPPSEAAGDE